MNKLGKELMPTHTIHICAKFHANASSKYRDTAARGIDVNGQRTDGQQMAGQMD